MRCGERGRERGWHRTLREETREQVGDASYKVEAGELIIILTHPKLIPSYPSRKQRFWPIRSESISSGDACQFIDSATMDIKCRPTPRTIFEL